MGQVALILTEMVAAARRGDRCEHRRLMAKAKRKVEDLAMEAIEMEQAINGVMTPAEVEAEFALLEKLSQPTPAPAEAPKKGRRTYSRRPKKTSPEAASPASGSGPTIALSPEQLGKLWRIVVGGELVIEGTGVTCHVSAASFEKALPVLLERL